MSIVDLIRQEVQRAIQRADNVVRRVLITVAPDTDYFTQATGAGDDVFDGAELWQQYGLASRPPVGGEGLMLCAGGAGEGGILVATQDRAHRPSLAASEVALHGPKASGSQGKVHMKADGAVDVVPATGKTNNLGGDATACADYLLKGTAFDTAMTTVLSSMIAAGTAWNASPKLLTDAAIYITLLAGAFTTLDASHTAGWLSTTSKVK